MSRALGEALAERVVVGLPRDLQFFFVNFLKPRKVGPAIGFRLQIRGLIGHQLEVEPIIRAGQLIAQIYEILGEIERCLVLERTSLTAGE